jgi:DNA-binding transcriptional MerR regulator
LLTIGAFARAVGLTASALRHYDECGLLPPAAVDDVTGYRYYTPDLAQRARLVAQMRDVGMSIAGMRTVLDGPPDEGRAVLERFVEEQTVRTARTAAVLHEVLSDLVVSRNHQPSALIEVRGPELAAAIRQVRAAADSDASSPLASVLIDATADRLDVVATNRYWMAVRILPLDTAVHDARSVLSLATASDLAAHLDTYDVVPLTITDARLTVGSRSFDGRTEPYPAHRIVLEGLEPTVTRAVLSRTELVDGIEAVGRAEVMVTLAATGVQVEETGGARTCTIDSVVSGPSMTVRLGSALTLRALATSLGPRVRWELSTAHRPIRMTSPYQRGFIALVMPLGQA